MLGGGYINTSIGETTGLWEATRKRRCALRGVIGIELFKGFDDDGSDNISTLGFMTSKLGGRFTYNGVMYNFRKWEHKDVRD